jgi:SAM-dependent methyltransferase
VKSITQDNCCVAEKAALNRVFKTMRGNDLLQISDSHYDHYSETARVLRTFYLDQHTKPNFKKPFIQAQADCLPIQSESIDIVLLIHQLDEKKEAHSILQEAYRVLRPNGQLIILGFNRCSLWYWFHRVSLLPSGFYPGKIKHALRALDFEITQHVTFGFWPPNVFAETLGLFCLPYAGGEAMLIATKKIPAVIPPILIKNFAGIRTST